MSRITGVGFVPREEQPASNLGAQQTQLTSTKSFGNSKLGEGGLRPSHYEDERLALWMNIILEGVIGC